MNDDNSSAFGYKAWPKSWQPSTSIRAQLEEAGLEDMSWINEGAPHWVLPLSGREHGIAAIWIYPKNPELRESWMGASFCAAVLKEDGLETSEELETDNLSQAISFTLNAQKIASSATASGQR